MCPPWWSGGSAWGSSRSRWCRCSGRPSPGSSSPGSRDHSCKAWLPAKKPVLVMENLISKTSQGTCSALIDLPGTVLLISESRIGYIFKAKPDPDLALKKLKPGSSIRGSDCRILQSSVADPNPDPHVKSGSGSISQRYGSGSGLPSENSKKNLHSYCFVTSFWLFIL